VGYLTGQAGLRSQIDAVGQSHVSRLVDDEPVPGCVRSWFACPRCRQQSRHLYLPRVQCWTCLGL